MTFDPVSVAVGMRQGQDSLLHNDGTSGRGLRGVADLRSDLGHVWEEVGKWVWYEDPGVPTQLDPL